MEKKKAGKKKRLGKKEIKEKICRAVKAAILGTGRIKITFKKKAINDTALKDFCLMENRGIIIMDEECAALLSTAKHTGMWGNPQNRTVRVALGYGFDSEEFIRIFADDIKDIEVVKVRRLKL